MRALRRARRARAQRPSGVRLARAGRRARGRRPRRAAPAQLPARLRDRDVLHARRRTARAATGATRCRASRLNCRGSRAESAVYGAALALWQRRLAESVDAFVGPERVRARPAARARRAAGDRARVIPSVQRQFATGVDRGGRALALAAGRLTPEKGFADAVAACRRRGRAARRRRRRAAARGAARARRRRALRRAASAPSSSAALRRDAALAIVPSRYAGDPAAGRARRRWPRGCRSWRPGRAGWPRPCRRRGSTRRGTSAALAERVRALFGDAAAGERALAVARARYARRWSRLSVARRVRRANVNPGWVGEAGVSAARPHWKAAC